MTNKKLVAANWKMNKTIPESEEFVCDITDKSKDFKCDVLICPPFISLASITKRCHGAGIYVGAQNCHWENSGAFTGEISAPMLSDIGVDYVILGHSERRNYFGETDEIIDKKVYSALQNRLKIILCVGETQEQRDCGKATHTVVEQVKNALESVGGENLQNVVIAYEPIWAIGTGKIITPSDAGKMCADIRVFIASKYSNEHAKDIRILYGGSITAKNSESFFSTSGIDGALIGGASLESGNFREIIKIAESF